MDASEVDPVYFDRTYYLAPPRETAAQRPYVDARVRDVDFRPRTVLRVVGILLAIAVVPFSGRTGDGGTTGAVTVSGASACRCSSHSRVWAVWHLGQLRLPQEW